MCKTGMSDDTGQARALLLDQLMQTRRRQAVLTYRQLLDALPLRVPKMQQLARLLEQLAEQDAQRGWPLRSALVVSQTGSGLPRQGFFQHLCEAGILDMPASEADAKRWHTQELQRIFTFDYPGEG